MDSIHQQMYNAGILRSTSDKWLGGVCGGLAKKFGVDVNAVRLLVFIFIMVAGSGLLAYIAAWIVMPDDTYRPASVGGTGTVPPVNQPWEDGPQDSIKPHN